MTRWAVIATLGAFGPDIAAAQATGSARLQSRLTERAVQTREIVYLLRQPETHAFDLYHDYTETRPGIGQYVNVVRAGSTVSNPAALILDTGVALETKILKGPAITAAGIDIGEPIRPETEIVVIGFPPVSSGASTRLRISETYTDPARYRLEGDELIWDRSFGRADNVVILPAGWRLTHSSAPGVVSLTEDGRIMLRYSNPRLDELQVLIIGRRRTP